MIQAQLGPWPSVALVLIGATLAVLGVYLPNGAPLLGLGFTLVGGVLGAIQAQRPANARTRASDRLPTAPGGVGVGPTDAGGGTPTPVRRGDR